MQIPVLIERVAGNGFRARSGEPLALTVEGSTRAAALQKLQELVKETVAAGGEMVCLDVPEGPPPWLRKAGWLDLNHPIVQEWMEIMEENRKKDDEDPNSP